jgi:hypothetical protein
VFGIENKKAAELQKNQLGRYQKFLSSLGLPNLLVFLAPSSYELPDEEFRKLDRQSFVPLTYREVIQWAEECLKESNLSEFERDYLIAFLEFIGELELKPFTNEELAALAMSRSYQDAVMKASKIVAELARDKRPEKSTTLGFVLTRTNSFSGFSLPIYTGIRFDTEGYFNDPLLEGQPELLAYVKDDEIDSEKAARTNGRLEEIANNTGWVEPLGARLEYFRRDRENQKQCRLAIRRKLGDFTSKDPAEIIDWLKRASSQLEEVLSALKVAI